VNVINLTKDSKIYTSNVFYVRGDWNTISDTNTLIDVGKDPAIFDSIEKINSGLGKNKIDQVILTHSHSDHIALLPHVIEKYKPKKIYALNKHIEGVNHVLKDGQEIRIGDKFCEVFHISAHSNDSVCIYCKENGILFAGDTFFPIEFENELLKAQNAFVISRLERKSIKQIFYGHGSAQDYSNRKFVAYKRIQP
jgi:glyoxylase-like metal-dependent hydrolase (beta-lactamase superfamily II)